MDEDTGDEAGTTEGVFVSKWQGDILYGMNEAVSGQYVLAYATDPPQAREAITVFSMPGKLPLYSGERIKNLFDSTK